MHRRVLAAALSGLLALVPSAAPAQGAPPTTGVITGVVLDQGHPVAGVKVGFPQPPRDGWVFPPVTTGADGRFRLENIAPGTYTVRFLTPGGGMDLYTEAFDLRAGQVKWITERLGPHGAMAGRILTNSGAPAAGATVGLEAGRRTFRTETDANGFYRLDYLPEGSTQAYAAKQLLGAPWQWVPRKTSIVDATLVTITNGHTTRVDERLLPLGAITGTFTDANGPAWVTVLPDNGNGNGDGLNNDPTTGAYTVYVRPGDHRLLFRTVYTWREQWATNATSAADATVFHVAEDQVIRHDERMMGDGTITGRLLDHTGEPLTEPATVRLIAPGNSEKANTTTDAAGNWSITIAPGSYEIRYEAGGRKQASGEVTPRSGNVAYQVLPEATTTVPAEKMLQPGAVAVTATLDGAPAQQFCADVVEPGGLGEVHSACTEDGTITIPEVTPTLEFTVVVHYPDAPYNYFGSVTAVAGTTTTVEVPTTTPAS
jgi:carboxypeptidase family protein